MYKFVKVLKAHLVNYCGYVDTVFDFSDGVGGVKPFTTFFGPNGVGKTTCIHAIRLAANPNAFKARERSSELMLRKSIHDEEYLPTVDNMKTNKKRSMLITVDFLTDQGIKTVQIDNMGLLRNDLGYDETPLNGWTYFADADNQNNTVRFLLSFEQAEKFIAFAETVYGYKCELGMPVSQGGINGYTDFIIKKGPVKVHFKSMSAGEKKIATLVSDLCQPINTARRDIVLIDNIEMHVYWKRHTKMIDKLREVFADKQIITTTHSSIVIKHVEKEAHFDLELYRPEYKLFEENIKVSSVILPKFTSTEWGPSTPSQVATHTPGVSSSGGIIPMRTTRVIIPRPTGNIQQPLPEPGRRFLQQEPRFVVDLNAGVRQALPEEAPQNETAPQPIEPQGEQSNANG